MRMGDGMGKGMPQPHNHPIPIQSFIPHSHPFSSHPFPHPKMGDRRVWEGNGMEIWEEMGDAMGRGGRKDGKGGLKWGSYGSGGENGGDRMGLGRDETGLNGMGIVWEWGMRWGMG